MSDVTQILSQIEQGDPRAAERLLPLVYDELRKLAAAKMAREQHGQTLQATALVHEAYLRLVYAEVANRGPTAGGSSPDPASSKEMWNSRGHFFAAAGEAMRRILIDQARRRNAMKRGGHAVREPLQESAIISPHTPDELLAVHEYLDCLAETDELAANLIRLKFFVGLNMAETAEALGVSVRTAYDTWAYARAWLHRKMTAD
jgi:RNA polymerase sigma factor (sigma-70 family)